LWIRAQTATNLFFDAEMMHLLKRANYAIKEIPIDFRVRDKDYETDGRTTEEVGDIVSLLLIHTGEVLRQLLETRAKLAKGLRAIEIALVQFSYDGVTTYQCGVGTVVLNVLKVIEELNERFLGLLRIKAYFVTPDYRHLPSYDRTLKHENRRRLEKTGGALIEVEPEQSWATEFGKPENWLEISQKGAEIAAEIIHNNKHTLVIAHDTAFAQLPLFLADLKLDSPTFKAIWLPHCTSVIYDGVDGWPERKEWEMGAVNQAVGYISEYMKGHLRDYYRAQYLVPFRTGIIRNDFVENFSQARIQEELKHFGIPLNKQLVFTIGRAKPIKGQDLVLDTFLLLSAKERKNLHLVILAPDAHETFGHSEYLKQIREKIRGAGLKNVTVIDSFESELLSLLVNLSI